MSTTNGTNGTNGAGPRPPAPVVFPTRERPQAAAEEEVGTELKLGDFQNVHALSVSEAKFLVEAILEARRKGGKRFAETEVLGKMQNYMDTFARFKDATQLEMLESLFTPHSDLDVFERALLASLCPGDTEEAKTLIPSLTDKISDEDLDRLTEDLENMRKEKEKEEKDRDGKEEDD